MVGQGIEKWEDKKQCGWKSGRIENNLVFSHMCLVGVEKWRSEKLFCLVENENERIENCVCINLLLYPNYIKRKLIIYKGEKGFYFILFLFYKLTLNLNKKKQKPKLKKESRWLRVISHIKPTFFPILSQIWGENSLFTKYGLGEKIAFSPIFHPWN